MHDQTNIRSIEECVQACDRFDECSHVEYWNGVCYLKRGPVRKSMSILSVNTGIACGIPQKVCDAGGCQ